MISCQLEGIVMTRRITLFISMCSVLLAVLSATGAAPTKPPATEEATINRVLTLDGERDFMRVPDSASLHSLVDSMTIELWFRAVSFYSEHGAINSLLRKNIGAGQENFLLRFRTLDGMPVLEFGTGPDIGTLQAFHDFGTGHWYHLAGTYNGKTLTAYVNGARVDSLDASGRLSIDESDLYIGKGDPEFSYGEYFHGELDEIRLWNVARSPEKIRSVMENTLTGREKGLIGYWNFDDGTARDLSGHGNDGRLNQIVESPRPKVEAPAKGTTEAARSLPPGARERARDRIVHLEESVHREVPNVPRLCDQLDIRKEKVSIGDCELYCEQEGKGIPLVLLHGGPGSTHHGFHPHFSQAGEFARVIYYDQRGCGLSDYEPGSGYSVDQAADDLDRLRKALGVEKWVVLGHSYGGLLAQHYATKHPESLKGLVLTCASTGLHGPSLPSRQRDFISAAERRKMGEIRRTGGLTTAQLIYNNFLNGDWKRQSYYRPTREQIAQGALYGWVHDKNFNGIMSNSTQRVDLAGAFAECPIPTLIIEAKWDMSWNTDKAEQLRENHPNAQFVMLEESGHSPFEDEPEEYFRALRSFMSDLSEVPTAKIEAWKRRLAAREQSTSQFISGLGWGRRSSEKIASKYDQTWLEQIGSAGTLLRIGFALYDAKRYDDALAAFRKLQEISGGDQSRQVMAIIWQGHMLDLLGKRAEAIERYREAADMGIGGQYSHSQYGLTYAPSAYASKRTETPFTRLENRDDS